MHTTRVVSTSDNAEGLPESCSKCDGVTYYEFPSDRRACIWLCLLGHHIGDARMPAIAKGRPEQRIQRCGEVGFGYDRDAHGPGTWSACRIGEIHLRLAGRCGQAAGHQHWS